MDIYAEKLERGMRLLETNSHLGKPREDWFPGCRCHQVERHLVLYQVVESEVQVARIFHESMDPARHMGQGSGLYFIPRKAKGQVTQGPEGELGSAAKEGTPGTSGISPMNRLAQEIKTLRFRCRLVEGYCSATT
jgi:ParE toxin of type II toxin-antitoxin system, parDE